MSQKKPNISIFTLSLGSGGAEKVISLLLKELKNDYTVTLVLFYNIIHFDIPEEIDVVILSNKGSDRPYFLRFLDFFRFFFKYRSITKRKKINISISFLAFPNLLNGIIAILNKNIKTIISERGFPSDNVTNKMSYYISKWFYPIFYNKCDKLFSNSVYINQDLEENFGVKVPMDVIYNPILIPSKTIESETLSSSKGLNIITAGTLNKRKNHHMILRALKGTPEDIRLTILGGGELHQFLDDKILEYNLSHKATLKGKVKNVNDYFLKSNCFILSSFTEGFPNALLEAMAMGLPCISTNCLSGPLEMLNNNEYIKLADGEYHIGAYGLLVNNDDDIALRKAIEYYQSNPNEREKYGRLSLQRSKDYELSKIYEQFSNYINS